MRGCGRAEQAELDPCSNTVPPDHQLIIGREHDR